MEKLNAKQILEIVEENMSVEEFAYCDYCIKDDVIKKVKEVNPDYDSFDWKKEEQLTLDFIGLGEIKEIDQYGGEDQGSTWYSIKYFKNHDVYIKTEGYYQSHHGTDFDEGYGYEVKPREKTITVYE